MGKGEEMTGGGRGQGDDEEAEEEAVNEEMEDKESKR